MLVFVASFSAENNCAISMLGKTVNLFMEFICLSINGLCRYLSKYAQCLIGVELTRRFGVIFQKKPRLLGLALLM